MHPRDKKIWYVGVASGGVYAIAEAANQRGGFFRSRDGGVSWERTGSYQAGGLYYNEIFPDPVNVDRVYSVDVQTVVTDDAGRTFRRLGERNKHVDNHVVWVDPDDTEHLLIGSDGGLYESFDRGQTYKFFENLPVTQFHRVEADNSLPFYRVYGGTQDNLSLGGPSRTRTEHGITNSDWFVTAGATAFKRASIRATRTPCTRSHSTGTCSDSTSRRVYKPRDERPFAFQSESANGHSRAAEGCVYLT